jgi:hypothetical protein
MNTQEAPKNRANPLLLNISPHVKSRVIESLFQDSATYSNQITNTLTGVRRVLSCLAELAELRQDDTNEIGGELALALSGLLEQEIKTALILLNGASSETGDDHD